MTSQKSCHHKLFADDTAVYLTVGGSEDEKVLQKDLDSFSMWESQWDMQFNHSKCQVVRVTTAKEVIKSVYTLHGQVLEFVTSARYLGVDISRGLTWNSNIDQITGKANGTLGYIRRDIKTKNQKARETAYNTLVLPQLEYAAPFGTQTPKIKGSSLKKSKDELHAGPSTISIIGQALQPCSTN